MAKTLDFIALAVIIMIASFVWCVLLFENVWLSLVVSASLAVAIVFSIKFFSKQKTKVSALDLATHFAIKGNEYVTNLVKTTLKNAEIDNTSTAIFLKNCAIFSCFKFGAVSSADIANMAKQAEGRDVKTFFVLANGIDRKAYQVANFLGIRVKYTKTSALAKYLAKHNALPDIKAAKRKMSLPLVFEIIFARANFKAYAFSGIVLVLTSFITPLRLYYIISGSACLLLAIFSIVFGGGNLFTENVFKQLENAAQTDCASNDNSDSKSN